MTPQTVNAYYHPLKNEIVFPAAILQPPFFNEAADDAVNYGGIGAVIGHEIGHGFDDQGSTCDGDGTLRDWWTAQDREAFETRTAALVDQYNALAPELGGGAARQRPADHRGEHRRPGRADHRLPGPPDRDGEQLPRAARRLHPRAAAVPQLGRDLAVQGPPRDGAASGWPPTRTPRRSSAATRSSRTSAPSHDAFGVTEGDGLWLPEDQRVKIW